MIWYLLILVGLMICTFVPAHASDGEIRLNTVGFLPDRPKQATIAATCDKFSVVRVSDGKAVFSGHSMAR